MESVAKEGVSKLFELSVVTGTLAIVLIAVFILYLHERRYNINLVKLLAAQAKEFGDNVNKIQIGHLENRTKEVRESSIAFEKMYLMLESIKDYMRLNHR